MSKNDRVPDFPRVEELAQIIADHYDGDLNLAEVSEPSQADIALARKIRNRFYRTEPADVHGYIAGARRLIWPLVVIVAIVIAITAITLWPNEGAQ